MTERVQIPFSANFRHAEKYAEYNIWALDLKASKHMAYKCFVSVCPTCMQGLFRAASRSGYFSVVHDCFEDLGQTWCWSDHTNTSASPLGLAIMSQKEKKIPLY